MVDKFHHHACHKRGNQTTFLGFAELDEQSKFEIVSKYPETLAEARKKINLECPFEEKDQVKRLGARWNKTWRKWQISIDENPLPFRRWLGNRFDTIMFNYQQKHGPVPQAVVHQIEQTVKQAQRIDAAKRRQAHREMLEAQQRITPEQVHRIAKRQYVQISEIEESPEPVRFHPQMRRARKRKRNELDDFVVYSDEESEFEEESEEEDEEESLDESMQFVRQFHQNHILEEEKSQELRESNSPRHRSKRRRKEKFKLEDLDL